MSHKHSTARSIGGRLLTKQEVLTRLGRSNSSLYRDIGKGLVPLPVKIGASSRWPEAEIDAVIQRAIEARDEEGAK